MCSTVASGSIIGALIFPCVACRIQENPAESAPAFWKAFEAQRTRMEASLDTLAARYGA